MQDKKVDIDKLNILDSNIDNIPNIINEMSGKIERQFSGPLPYQVIENLTPVQREKLLNNFINQEAKEHEKDMKVLELLDKKGDKEYKLKKLIIVLGIPSFLAIVIICVMLNKENVLYDILKIFLGFIAGIGFKNFKNENKE